MNENNDVYGHDEGQPTAKTSNTRSFRSDVVVCTQYAGNAIFSNYNIFDGSLSYPCPLWKWFICFVSAPFGSRLTDKLLVTNPWYNTQSTVLALLRSCRPCATDPQFLSLFFSCCTDLAPGTVGLEAHGSIFTVITSDEVCSPQSSSLTSIWIWWNWGDISQFRYYYWVLALFMDLVEKKIG